MPIYLKYIITAAIVVLASELANRSEKIGALVGALPVMTILVVLWIFAENKSTEGANKIADYAFYTFWYVLPTLPMFLVMSEMLKKGSNFWLSLAVYILGTVALFFMLNFFLRKFNISLI